MVSGFTIRPQLWVGRRSVRMCTERYLLHKWGVSIYQMTYSGISPQNDDIEGVPDT